MFREQLFTERFEARIKGYFVDTLYIGASEDPEPGSFKTNCENLLEAWVHQDLADVAIDVAQSTLMAQLEEVVDFPDRDDTFSRLKKHVTLTCSEKLQWPPNSFKKIQATQVRGYAVGRGYQACMWYQACMGRRVPSMHVVPSMHGAEGPRRFVAIQWGGGSTAPGADRTAVF